MFIAEYGELCVFGLVPFSVDTVSESLTISGMEPDLKGYSVQNFETVVPEMCFEVSFLCNAVAAAAVSTWDAFPLRSLAVATAAFSMELHLMVRLKEKGSVKPCFYWFAICVPLRFLAQGILQLRSSAWPCTRNALQQLQRLVRF